MSVFITSAIIKMKLAGLVIPRLDRGIQSLQEILDCPIPIRVSREGRIDKPDNDDFKEFIYRSNKENDHAR